MTNTLRAEIRKQILSHLRIEAAEIGEHVPEKRFAFLGTSRGPVRAALSELAHEGVLEYRSNKGYYVRDLAAQTAEEDTGAEERTYRAIAADRLVGALPENVTINEVVRRYSVTKATALRVLGRIEREGWADRRAGRGFTFTAMVDTPEAYREIYELRRVIEPAGILAEQFTPDKGALLQCLKLQKNILKSLGRMDQGELYSVQSSFHEHVMAMSGNRFLLQTLQRVNSLRRLATYRQELDLSLVRQQSTDHIAIIELLLDDDRINAAERMRLHLGGEQRTAVLRRIFSDA